jgi:multidrug resistance efflux pump
MKLSSKPPPIFQAEVAPKKVPWGKMIYLTLLGVLFLSLGWWGFIRVRYMEAPALVQYREFLVQAKEPGRVAEVPVKIGDLVSPETLVAILDITRRGMDQWSPDMIFRTQDSIQKIIAEETVVCRELALKKGLAANLGKERQRAKNLLNQGVIKYSEYKKLDLDHQSLSAVVGELQGRAQALQRQRQVLEDIYQQHLPPCGRQLAELKPATWGIVIKQDRELGEVVLAGQAVLTLIDPDNLYVKAFFPEKFQPFLHLGNDAVILLPDGSKETGEVKKLYPASEPLPPEYQKYYMTRQRAIVAEIGLKSADPARMPYGLTVKARISKPLAAWW